MKFEWNYYEPRKILPNREWLSIACKLNEDKSISYWIVDEEAGLRLINIPCPEEE